MNRYALAFLLLLSLPGFGQQVLIPGTKRPLISGTTVLQKDVATGVMTETDITGATKPAKVAVPGESMSMARFRTVNFGAFPPKTIIITDSGIGGTFVLDSLDTTTPDDSLFTLVRGGYRFKYPVERAIDIRKWGVQTLPMSSTLTQSPSVRTANVIALTKAFNSGYDLYGPADQRTETNGTVRVRNRNVKAMSFWGAFAVRQMIDDTLFSFDNSLGMHQPIMDGWVLEAGVPMSIGQAIYLKGYSPTDGSNYSNGKPVGFFTRLIIKPSDVWRPGASAFNNWLKGIEIDKPTQLTIENSLFIGGAANGYSQDGTIAIDMHSDRTADVVMLHNNQIGNWGTGIKMYSPNSFGIEGINIDYQTIIAYDGINLSGNGGPGYTITNSHLNVKHTAFRLNQVSQGFITNCLVYHEGNSIAGQYSSYIEATSSSLWSVKDCKFLYQEAGKTNDPTGALIQGSPAVFSSLWDIQNNYWTFKSGGNRSGIVFQQLAQQSKVINNQFVGALKGIPTPAANFGFEIHNNFPLDVEDSFEIDTLSPVPGLPGQYQLDLTNARPAFIIIPASQSGKSLNRILSPVNRQFTIQTVNPMTIVHDVSYIRLAGMTSMTTTASQKITFLNTSYSTEEVSRTGTPYVLPIATASTLGGSYAPSTQAPIANSSAPTSVTLDMAAGTVFSINVGTGKQTLVINTATVKPGVIYTITRFDNNTAGPVDISVSSGFLQDATKTNQTTIGLPNTTGHSYYQFISDGSICHYISGL